ncbi:MAG TPA: carboxypeptidase-like regulatory domain-containing protein [Planctomycetota bacterium]
MKSFAAAVLLLAVPSLAQEAEPPAATAVEFRITDAKGGPIQLARVQVLSMTKKGSGYSAVKGQPPRDLAPRDFPGDHARFDDLPAGRYVLLVDAEHHARTLSEPFELPAAKVPQVTVRLQTGATLEGVVVDPQGKPMANVDVTTGVGGPLADSNPFAQLLQTMLVRTTTDATVRTAADGSFRFEHVAAGEYRIVARHAAFPRAQLALTVAGDGRTDVPIAFEPGVVVTGTVTRDGKPVEGFEVLLQNELATVPDLKLGLTPVRLVALTDEKGTYRLPEPVPLSGTYAIMASDPRVLKDRAAQIKATRRVTTLKAGTEQVEDLQLPAK